MRFHRRVSTAILLLVAPLAQALSGQVVGARGVAEVEGQIHDLFSANNASGSGVGGGLGGGHTNNWAVLVCSSRYWFNYRHMANTLAMYRTIKRLGMPDSNIILMLADDVACNARNSFPGAVYANKGKQMDLYGEHVSVDYRGYEVTVESFLRLLTGRHPPHTPPSKRLLTDASSNVFIYMTGHGGNEFLKFQDNEEISAFDIADAIEQMHEKRRFNKLLYVIDTCQANTMYSKFYSPNVIATGSSELGESSYSHHNDHDIGTAVIDSYTHYILEFFETLAKTSKATIQDFFNTYDPARIHSHPGISTSLSPTPPDKILVTDFLGAVAAVEPLSEESVLDPLSPAGRRAVTLAASSTGTGDGWEVRRRGSGKSIPSPGVLAMDERERGRPELSDGSGEGIVIRLGSASALASPPLGASESRQPTDAVLDERNWKSLMETLSVIALLSWLGWYVGQSYELFRGEKRVEGKEKLA